jgi:hypothetical protein
MRFAYKQTLLVLSVGVSITAGIALLAIIGISKYDF